MSMSDLNPPPTVSNPSSRMSALLLFAIALLVFGSAAYHFLGRQKESRANDAQPIRDVEATVQGKRTDVLQQPKDINPKVATNPTTRRFVSFQCQDGQAREFEVTLEQDSLIAPGTRGALRYQGTRFRRFEKKG